MAKEEVIQFEGLVLELLPDARFRVKLDSGHEIIAYTAGKMKKNRIKTLAGDRVTVNFENAGKVTLRLTGAEIEQAIVAGLHAAAAERSLRRARKLSWFRSSRRNSKS